ncbi:hypothetical protein [Gillisia sp. Hel_I_86]|uniref:hypothetical protein n=1 Tax=Gillisia sp. Hel_I_86 TaxID=1249981 RepID=UPI0016480AEF|nr:hypothetical protein [Gillisia sp. Hel_I_86]
MKNLEGLQLVELDIRSKIETDGGDVVETPPLKRWWDDDVEVIIDRFWDDIVK